ncbi:CRTAC1 family protein [Aureliella helgolandensis]|uniref:ASPIC and UnbV n=1 Tax=Aureliella helgolandensis TaxID=2527968 RepID=A0A518GA29_9BACT|nr:CRTAC1 family protein [Aureliella helgolandensis]QDV25447.1 ASPIC and UnbV [Aureliella helgolandensis]
MKHCNWATGHTVANRNGSNWSNCRLGHWMERLVGESHWASGICAVALALALLGMGADAAEGQRAIRFTDVTDASGIDFEHSHGGSDQGYIIEGMSTGVVTFDYDRDGWIDIYFLNGSRLKGTPAGPDLHNALYRNLGDGTFEDVTEEAGVGDVGYGLGAAAADYDGDGWLDLYINNFGKNVLYRNNGNKTFSNMTESAGVGNGAKVGAGVAFFDMDGDEDLDLYVANYVNFAYENHVPILINGKRFQAGPQYYQAVPDTLFRNEGDGTFSDWTQQSGIGRVATPSMGVVCFDSDSDGDIDVFVANDGQPNCLFMNDGSGVFEEMGLLFGVARDFNGKANSSMGVDVGDYDGDGLFDLMTTSYQAEMPVLYHNLGDGLFEDATNAARITSELFAHVNWGTGLVDFDNDGDQDLFIACGHFDRIEDIDDRTSRATQNYLLENVGGSFIDVSGEAGAGMAVVESSRGAAFEDFDNDGDVDVLVLNSATKPTLLRNDTPHQNHWIEIELQQAGMNRMGVGSIVKLEIEGSVQSRTVVSGRGYQSHFGDRLHFGLAGHSQPVEVRVHWPNGTVSSHSVEPDTRTVLQGSPAK